MIHLLIFLLAAGFGDTCNPSNASLPIWLHFLVGHNHVSHLERFVCEEDKLVVGRDCEGGGAEVDVGRVGHEDPGGNCIKIGVPGKSILGDYFRENRTSRRPFLLPRISFPGRPSIFVQFIPPLAVGHVWRRRQHDRAVLVHEHHFRVCNGTNARETSYIFGR